MPERNLTRRRILKNGLVAASGLVASNAILPWSSRAAGRDDDDCPRIVPTERGPFYPRATIPADADLTSEPNKAGQADGQVLYLFGKILGPDCRPLSDAHVEIWQADSNGRYKHPDDEGQLDPGFGYFGHVLTGQNGGYLFKTIVPAPYQFRDIARAPHIHLRINTKVYGGISTEVYFAGNQGDRLRENDRVFQSRRNPGRLIQKKQHPDDFADLGIEFDGNSLCCQYDLAYAQKRRRNGP